MMIVEAFCRAGANGVPSVAAKALIKLNHVLTR